MMVSGGDEKAAFWFMYAILEKSHQQIPFDGIAGFYHDGFPLLTQYLSVFNELFAESLPKLHAHFEEEGFPPELWLHKWF